MRYHLSAGCSNRVALCPLRCYWDVQCMPRVFVDVGAVTHEATQGHFNTHWRSRSRRRISMDIRTSACSSSNPSTAVCAWALRGKLFTAVSCSQYNSKYAHLGCRTDFVAFLCFLNAKEAILLLLPTQPTGGLRLNINCFLRLNINCFFIRNTPPN